MLENHCVFIFIIGPDKYRENDILTWAKFLLFVIGIKSLHPFVFGSYKSDFIHFFPVETRTVYFLNTSTRPLLVSNFIELKLHCRSPIMKTKRLVLGINSVSICQFVYDLFYSEWDRRIQGCAEVLSGLKDHCFNGTVSH